MIGGTLTLFLVLQNIGLPESNYVQIALFGMARENGLPSSDKTIIFTDNWLILLPMMLVLANF
jgi:hypothetical protein